jgi:hypothetical protein
LEKAALFLSPQPAHIVAPDMHKDIRLEVISPLPSAGIVKKDAVWQIAYAIYGKLRWRAAF